VAVLEGDDVTLLAAVDGPAYGHHRAAEPAVGSLDDKVGFGGNGRHLRAAPGGLGEDVVLVAHGVPRYGRGGRS
jgi:hypothetical protein